MRLAVGIIAIMLGLVIVLQSCTVSVGGGLLEDESITQAGAVGVFVGFAFFVGGAFAFALPMVSMVLFVIAALFGFMAGGSGEFSDLSIWGGAALILAVMALFAWRAQRKAKQADTGTNEWPKA